MYVFFTSGVRTLRVFWLPLHFQTVCVCVYVIYTHIFFVFVCLFPFRLFCFSFVTLRIKSNPVGFWFYKTLGIGLYAFLSVQKQHLPAVGDWIAHTPFHGYVATPSLSVMHLSRHGYWVSLHSLSPVCWQFFDWLGSLPLNQLLRVDQAGFWLTRCRWLCLLCAHFLLGMNADVSACHYSPVYCCACFVLVVCYHYFA